MAALNTHLSAAGETESRRGGAVGRKLAAAGDERNIERVAIAPIRSTRPLLVLGLLKFKATN